MKITTRFIRNSLLIAIVVFGLAVFYKFSPYKIVYIGSYDKIWAHRVNSLQKLDSALDHFKGIELDLVYNSKEDFLDVNHPPRQSIGLSFDYYMSKIPKEQYPFLWLDIKNLNITNAEAIKLKLLHILSLYDYPQHKILIETRYPKAFTFFTDTKFQLSYYFPYKMYKKDNATIKKDLKTIDSVTINYPSIALSGFYLDYSIINDKYPNKTKYFWFNGELESLKNYEITKKILEDTTVKAILIPYKSLRGNR